MKEFIDTLKKNISICKYVYTYTLFFAIYKTIMQPINAFISVFTYTYSLKYVIDSVQAKRRSEDILLFLGILLIVNIAIRIADAILERIIMPIANEKLKMHMQVELFDKAKNIDLNFYDNSDFYNDFILAFSHAEEKVLLIFEDMMTLLRMIFTVLSLVGIILLINYIGLIIVLFSAFFSILISAKINKIIKQRIVALKPHERKADYVKRVFYLTDHAKDIKLYSISEIMKNEFSGASEKMKTVYKSSSTKMFFLNFINQYLLSDFLFLFVLIVILLYQTIVLKTHTFGAFASMFNATNQLKQTIMEFAKILLKLNENCTFINSFIKIINIQSKIFDKDTAKNLPNETKTIQIKNLSFAYDYPSSPILKNINITIKKGEKIAITGYNGAGKTSLMKLLLRFYDVSSGQILLDDIDIKEYKLKEYRKSFVAVFQDYQIYATSIEKNITMSNKNISNEEERKLKDIIDELDLDWIFQKFNQGLKTDVTKEFMHNGAVFSGGNEQKLAIARVLYSDSNYVILDEPSSALDPIAEYKLMQTITDKLKDKTIFFITHRLSIARIADQIILIENGKIVENGTHKKLLDLNGIYSKMYKLQASKYK